MGKKKSSRSAKLEQENAELRTKIAKLEEGTALLRDTIMLMTLPPVSPMLLPDGFPFTAPSSMEFATITVYGMCPLAYRALQA